MVKLNFIVVPVDMELSPRIKTLVREGDATTKYCEEISAAMATSCSEILTSAKALVERSKVVHPTSILHRLLRLGQIEKGDVREGSG